MSQRPAVRAFVLASAVCLFGAGHAFAQKDYALPANVSGVGNGISSLKLTINLTTTNTQSAAIILYGGGAHMMVMANCGSTGAFTGTITLQDGSPGMPQTALTNNATYKPTVYGTPTVPTSIRFPSAFEGDPNYIFDTWEAVTPWGTGTLNGVSALNGFGGNSPNGSWFLKVVNVTINSATLTITTPLDVQLTKSHADPFKQGDTGKQYKISVRNVSTTPLTSRVLSMDDTLPSGLTATGITSTAPWSCTLSPLRCTATTGIAAVTSLPDITLTVDVGATATTPLVNHAALTSPSGIDGDPSDDFADDSTTILQTADLSITIDDGVTTVIPGDPTPITFTVVVSNPPGSSTITNAGAYASFPYVYNGTFSKTPAGGATSTQTSGSYVSDSVTLPPGSSMTYHITGTLDPAAPAGPLNNTANVYPPSDGFDPNPANNQATDVDTSTPVANLSITKTGPLLAGLDTDLTWTVKVTNAGPSDAQNVTITDPLPIPFVSQVQTDFVNYVSLSNSGDTINDTASRIAAGTSVTLNFVGHVPPNVAANSAITNTVTATCSSDPDTSDNTSGFTSHTPAPDLTVAATHSGTFAQGDSAAACSIVVTNSGGAATTADVSVSDTLPPSLTLMQISGNGWTCVGLTCTRSDALPPAQSYPAIDIVVAVAPKAPPFVQNIATVSGGGEINDTNDTSIDGTVIVQMPDLTVTQSVPADLVLGQTGRTMTWTVTNSGGTPTSGAVSVQQQLSNGFFGITVNAVSGTGWTCTTTTLSCSRSDPLAAGASYPTITVTFDVEPSADDFWTSDVLVSGGGEVDPTNNDSTVSFTVYAPWGPPFPFFATTTSATSVNVVWGPVLGATHYDIYRAPTIEGPWQKILSTSALTFDDTSLPTGITYLYKATAVSATQTSDFSRMNPATLIVFDDPVLQLTTPIRLVHIQQLESAVTAMRFAAELPVITFPAPANIKASDITNLQNALRDARNVFGLPDFYGPATIVTPGMPIRRADVSRLRNGVR